MKQCSADRRERLLGAIDAGLPLAEAARLFRVCPGTIGRWRRRQRTTGSVAALPRPGRTPRLGPAHAPASRAQIAAAPDATLARHRARWATGQGGRPVWPRWRGPSAASASRSKKVPRASERDEAARAAWWTETARLDPATLVFVDESGTDIAVTPRYGRAPRGQRVVGAVPRNRGPNVTLLAAMGSGGIAAAVTMTGATDGAVRAMFVDRSLVPSLRPGQTVIWDNLSVHKNQDRRKAIEAAGRQLRFLPAYSPAYSPIAPAFSKLKTALRRAGARDRDALEDAIAAALATITADDAAGWFGHCGYALPAQLL